jgi:hypothetical protein
MFPLAAKTFPESAEELKDAINNALAEFFDLPSEGSGASVSGEPESIKSVKIDLDDAEVRAGRPPPKLKGTGKRSPGPKVQKLDLSAQPIKYDQAKLFLKIAASGLEFEFDRDRKGRAMLVLTNAKSGKVDARISKSDIEALATEAATRIAADQGIKVQEMDLKLRSLGPRSLAADVRIKAKKIVSGVIQITGRLDIDDELTATLSDLECRGEGLVGSAVSGVVQSKLELYNGKTIPLMAFSLGDVALRDIKLDLARKGLHVTADFGTA